MIAGISGAANVATGTELPLGVLLASRPTGFRAHRRFGLDPSAPGEAANVMGKATIDIREVRPGFGAGHAAAPTPGQTATCPSRLRSGHDRWPDPADTGDATENVDARRQVRSQAREAEVDRAREDGFAAGWGAGHLAAETALGVGLAELDRLASKLLATRAIDPQTLAAALADTVHALLAELLEADPALVVQGLEARARRALASMAEREDPCVLWLAPAEADALGSTLARPGLSIVADPTLARGALRLTTAISRIDDTLPGRLARLAPMLAEAAAHAAVSNEAEGTLDRNAA